MTNDNVVTAHPSTSGTRAPMREAIRPASGLTISIATVEGSRNSPAPVIEAAKPKPATWASRRTAG